LKFIFPSALTLANLLCGILAIYFTYNGHIYYAPWFIAIAAVLDFFDGFVARLLKAQSEFGVQLDSLADVVTFGVANALVTHHFYCTELMHFPDETLGWHSVFIFSLGLGSAARLAKFNIDKRQLSGFLGLPTPACTLFFVSLLIAYKYGPWLPFREILENTYTLPVLALLFTILMNVELPMPAFKFKHGFAFNTNKVNYVFLGISIFLFAFFKEYALTLCLTGYIIFSFFLKKSKDD